MDKLIYEYEGHTITIGENVLNEYHEKMNTHPQEYTVRNYAWILINQDIENNLTDEDLSKKVEKELMKEAESCVLMSQEEILDLFTNICCKQQDQLGSDSSSSDDN